MATLLRPEEAIAQPCEHCPWLTANQGKKTPWGFYTKANLKRLWNQIRGGGRAQGCHPTDPSHPDHVAAGAKPGATPKECAGSVILILREFKKLQACSTAPDQTIDPAAVDKYLVQHKQDGLKRRGLLYWLYGRWQLGGTLFGEGPKLPNVDVDHPDISYGPSTCFPE